MLLLVANGAPLLAQAVLGVQCSQPLDGGRCWLDGRRLLGASKTWRGVFAALLLTSAVAPLVDAPWEVGATVAVLAMLGDVLTSFVKRRFGHPAGRTIPGLDQLFEALLPALLLSGHFELGMGAMTASVVLFVAIGLLLAGLLRVAGTRIAR